MQVKMKRFNLIIKLLMTSAFNSPLIDRYCMRHGLKILRRKRRGEKRIWKSARGILLQKDHQSQGVPLLFRRRIYSIKLWIKEIVPWSRVTSQTTMPALNSLVMIQRRRRGKSLKRLRLTLSTSLLLRTNPWLSINFLTALITRRNTVKRRL